MIDSSNIQEAVKGFLLPIIKQAMVEIQNEQDTYTGPRTYTREQVEKILHIKTTSFYRLAKRGKITLLKVGGKTVVDADKLDEAIENEEIIRYGRSSK